MVTDTVADFLARMQNGISRKMEVVDVPSTKTVSRVVAILKEEGLIDGFEEENKVLKVRLAYVDGSSVLSKLTKISKPGKRIYTSYANILPIMNGRGISIISTSNGVMTGAKAKHAHLGGELICEIW